MNLRKDHSHKMFLLHATHHIDTPVIKKDFQSDSSMLQSHCSAYNVTYLLQRRMPWLEDRWRTQRTVLHISNCRFPRKIRILNAFCELGLPNSRGWRWPQYAVVRTPKFGWYSHVVAFGADVIVEVSVPSFRAPIVFNDLLCLIRWSASIRETELFFAHVHDLLRDYPLNLSI